MQKSKQGTLRFLSETAGRKKGYMAALLLVQIVLGVSGVCYALFLRNLIDCAVGKQLKGFWNAVTVVVALTVLQIALRAFGRFLEAVSQSGLENCFKKRLFSALLMKEYGAVADVHSAKWINKLTSDTAVVANGMTHILPNLGGTLVRLFGAVGALLLLQPKLMCAALLCGIVFGLFSVMFRKRMKQMHKEVQKRDGALRSGLQEYLGNMAVIRSYVMEKQSENDIDSLMKEHQKARIKWSNFSNICNVGFGMLMNGAYVGGVVFCGYGILSGTMSYGTLMAVTQLIGQVQGPVANLSGTISEYYAMTASAERLMEAEKRLPGHKTRLISKQETQRFYEQNLKEMVLEHIDFAYPGKEEYILENCSVHIQKGECVALVGPSGCGKSTILKLFLGLYRPQSGEYFLKNKQGSQVDPEQYRYLFAYVPQGNGLMSGTIREAVAFADLAEQYNEERLHEALRIACAEEFVQELEQGVDTPLGERGQGLSEGQMQRLAIARAVFSERPVLMLDECTSALDEETERKLLLNLHSVADKTVLIVTHRPAALAICNRIILLEEGGKWVEQ